LTKRESDQRCGRHAEPARYHHRLYPRRQGIHDGADHTCSNWTSSTAGSGSAQVGHFDRNGGSGNISWNSTHASRGCSQENLVSTGGAGLFYCFAIN
jgi:hypothetical protein